jgi:hypothetical protein
MPSRAVLPYVDTSTSFTNYQGHGQGSSSRTESPNPGPREGILVNLGDGVEQHIGSSLKKELKVDENGDLAVFSKSPDDMHNIIVEQPAAKAGDPEMVGDSAPPAPESSDSDKTAIMGETPIAVGAVKASADLVDDPIPETPIEPPSDVPETPTSDSAPSETTKTKKSNGKRRKGKNRK